MTEEDFKTALLDIANLKKSVEVAHQDIKVTHNQVSDVIKKQNDTDKSLKTVEAELREMKEYVTELEDYCISLDMVIRKHHLIIAGVRETKDESLAIICLRILQICHPTIDVTDFDYCYRIGNVRQGGNKVRPILVKLVKESVRREIIRNSKLLADSTEYSKVYINEDMPQVINDRRANIRSVHMNAKSKGHNSKMQGTRVTVDNVSYSHKELENLPEGLKLSDSKTVEVRGGLAFASEYSYLSNLYECEIEINGQRFGSSEQAYQFIRATCLGAPELAHKIMCARDSKECKKLSIWAKSTPEWDGEKHDRMKLIVTEKFYQNKDLQEKLLKTGGKSLFEATTDIFWGIGAHLGSKVLKTGAWSGMNHLGIILSEVRNDIRRSRGWEEFKLLPLPAAPEQNNSNPRSSQGNISFMPPNYQTQGGRRGRSKKNAQKNRGQPQTQPDQSAHAQYQNVPQMPQGINPYQTQQMQTQQMQPFPATQQMLGSQLQPAQLSQLQGHFNPPMIPGTAGMYPDLAQLQLQQAQYFNTLMQNQNLALYGSNSSQPLPINQSGQILSHLGNGQMINQSTNYQSQTQPGTSSNSRFVPGNVANSSMCLNSPLPSAAGQTASTLSQPQLNAVPAVGLPDSQVLQNNNGGAEVDKFTFSQNSTPDLSRLDSQESSTALADSHNESGIMTV